MPTTNERNELTARYLSAKRRLFDLYYEKLNDCQREAVFFADGNLLVLAGAGSGKTTVLVNRIVHLIRYGNAYHSPYAPVDLTEARVKALEEAASLPREQIAEILPEFISAPCAPWNMLAITFTNKAAGEIKTRLCDAMGDPDAAKEVWAGTFHSICMRILRVYAERRGYEAGFTIYDTDDQKSLLSGIMKKLEVDSKLLPVKSVLGEIGRAKDNLLDPDEYEREYAARDVRRRTIAKLYREYQKHLVEANAMDFDDIIFQTVRLLETDAEVRERYQNKFRYVCVDEFQDTNLAQFRLTALFAGGYQNLMVVGDDDQSIYKFRGAVIDNIIYFDRKFKNTKIIKLEQNYRSTSVILEAANGVIEKNTGRHGKALWTERRGGEKLTLRTCEDTATESRYLAERIQSLVAEKKYTYRDMAILYRMNMQSRALEQTFVRSGIPYRMLGGLRFNDRKEIRDLVAYLQLIINPSDRERFRRVINEPRRGLGQKTVDAVVEIAVEQSCPVLHVLRDADRYAALGRSAEKLKGFYRLIRSLRELLDTDISLESFVTQVLDRTGYRQMLIDGGEEEKERLENIGEFLTGVAEYEKSTDTPTLVGFLEENALVADVDKYDETADAVVMMTVHAAKGLEFPVVFLPGMEDGIFPGAQNIASGSQEDMEEERRLAYVALTRAKNKIFITHTKLRMMNGRTQTNDISRFVKEIPSHLIVEDTPTRYYDSYSPYRNQGYNAKPRTYIADGVATAKPTPAAPQRKAAADLNLKAGDRVSHAVFGEGEILSARQMGADVLYEVVFDRVGTKKLMGTYARLKKLS